MIKFKIIMILAVCLLVAACRKREYPEDKIQLGPEDIYFNGTVDNNPLSLKIGTDGYYCYSSYTQAKDSIYMFEGELKKYNCNPCPLSLRVQLSDYRQRAPGSPIPADSCLRTGPRNFLPGLPRVYTLSFMSHSNKEAASYLWETSDGSTGTNSVISCDFAQAGSQTVSLRVRTTGNCESVVVNKIFLSSETGLFACSVSATNLQGNKTAFSPVIIGGKAPFRYSWSFGDTNTSDEEKPLNNYKWGGSYPVTLRIEDANNQVCESNYIHVTANDKSSCAANMSMVYTNNRIVSYNGAKLQFTDESNTILRSDNVTQPTGSYFEIINSQPYASNEKGEAGRLLTLRFNVLLTDGSRKIWLKSENTAIVVSYK